MVRTYKRKLPGVDKSKMKAAVLSVLRDKLSLRAAAILHSVKRSTLQDWLKKTNEEQAMNDDVPVRTHGHNMIFSLKAEKALSAYVLSSNDMLSGLSTRQLRAFFYESAKKLGLEVPPMWETSKMAGLDWMNGFIKRNPAINLPMSTSKKTYELKNFNALFRAIKAVSYDQASISAAAKSNGVCKATLMRYLGKVNSEFNDLSRVSEADLLERLSSYHQKTPPKKVFTYSQEKEFISNALKSVNYCNGLTAKDLQELAYQFAMNLSIECPISWEEKKMAGIAWYRAFIRRHKELSIFAETTVDSNNSDSMVKDEIDQESWIIDQSYQDLSLGQHFLDTSKVKTELTLAREENNRLKTTDSTLDEPYISQDIKKSTCPVCATVYDNIPHLGSHVGRLHKGVEPFSCKICGHKFSTQSFIIKTEYTNSEEVIIFPDIDNTEKIRFRTRIENQKELINCTEQANYPLDIVIKEETPLEIDESIAE